MVAVIGDVHGCFYTLVDLFNKIKEKYGHIDIYCVGDLVDRGQHSYSVMKFIIDEKIKFTPGNHDYMFLHGVAGLDTFFAQNWIYNGEIETLKSYSGYEEYLVEHATIIKNSPFYYNLEDCFICHAGISVQYVNELHKHNFWEQLDEVVKRDYDSAKGVLWTRDPLLNLGKLQVVGHTRQDEVKIDEESNAIFIDTGACQNKKLTAAIVHQNNVIDLMSTATKNADISG